MLFFVFLEHVGLTLALCARLSWLPVSFQVHIKSLHIIILLFLKYCTRDTRILPRTRYFIIPFKTGSDESRYFYWRYSETLIKGHSTEQKNDKSHQFVICNKINGLWFMRLYLR